MLGTVFGSIWWVVTLPIRLLVGAIELLGRLTALGLGFALMVVGVALWAGSAAIFGVPTFVVGVLLTVRSLD